MHTIRVSIFEDNKHLRESLYYLVNGTEGLTCVGAFPDAQDIIFHLQQNKPEVVLMDIEMPGINGIEAVKIIKKEFPEIQILMQTVFQDDDNIFHAVCAGASGYILKSTSPAQYIESIKDVFHGGAPMTGIIARRVLELFTKNITPKGDSDYNLTEREKEILTLLTQGKSYKMIADNLGLAFETVRTHMKRIYTKLHVNSNTEAVLKAMKERIV
ncbi:MAG: response regulator transcription factor [Fimbriimonadaceae bacterium]|nr:response regulator transcription factor [Chitinophagales bacterium]